MVKELFLPEQIGGSYIFEQTYLGLEITKPALVGTKLSISGKTATILDFYHLPILKKEDETPEESTIRTLEELGKKAGYCAIKLGLPNNIAIFKELTFPFLEKEKIRQVLPYDLEPQIPFTINDIAFDFIITKQNHETKKSTVLVGIVQKKDISYYLDLLEKAHFSIKNITIDIFSFYNMFSINPQYKKGPSPVALMDIGFQYSTIAYVYNNELIAIRSLNYGLNHMAKDIAEKTGKTAPETLEHLLRFGCTKTPSAEMTKTITTILEKFSKQIRFTLDAFSAQIVDYEIPKKIILLTHGTQIKELDAQLNKTLSIPTEFFATTGLVSSQLKSKKPVNTIPMTNVLSLGAAYPFSPTAIFNLLSSLDFGKAKALLQRQLVAGLILLIMFFGTLIAYGYIQQGTIKKKINKAKQSALNELKEEFDIPDRNIATAVESAQQKLTDDEAIWEGFSGQFKYSFLKYLQELCVNIDREGIGLDLKKLIMNKENITLIGQVSDYKALKTFEEELNESKLFKLATIPQEPKFEVKLIIKQGDEEPS